MHSNWRASPPHHHVRQAGHAFKLFSVAVKLRLEKQKPSYNCFPASPGPEKKKPCCILGKLQCRDDMKYSLSCCPWKCVQSPHGRQCSTGWLLVDFQQPQTIVPKLMSSIPVSILSDYCCSRRYSYKKTIVCPEIPSLFSSLKRCVYVYFFFIYHWMVNALYILLAKLHRTWCKAPFNVAFRTLQAWVSLSTAEGCRTLKYFNLLLMTRQEKKKTDPKFSAFPINPKMGVINILHYSQWLVEKKTLHPASFFFFFPDRMALMVLFCHIRAICVLSILDFLQDTVARLAEWGLRC